MHKAEQTTATNHPTLMKTIALFLLTSLLLSSCGEDAASKKLAADTEARVTASIQQLLGQAGDPAGTTAFVQVVHNWYQSEVPNQIKLNPKTEAIYRTHAAILQEVAANEPKLVQHAAVTPAQAEGIKTKYQQLVAESAARVQELTALATSKTSMSEAEQLKYVSDLADKQTHHLALVRYYSKKMANTLALKEQEQKGRQYRLETFGHY
jgi:type II secretory pathway predicted ATPase ExeA